MRRTKIVATIGPATWDPPRLEELLRAGLDVVRLNFSHADRDHSRRVILQTRQISAELGRPVAVLCDLQGPRIRTGKLAGATPVQLVPGRECSITTEQIEGTAERFSTSYAGLPADVRRGEQILLSDGRISLEVQGTTKSDVRCKIVIGGTLAEHQGINLPGTMLNLPSLTEKDVADLAFCLSLKVDFIALSFVRKADDILALRRKIEELGRETPIVAKIEKPEALEHIEAIMEVSDAVMVARGDLGVEMPAQLVPLEQKRLIARCNLAGKPVITATQMLESMVHSPRPTRAEASDVANAIFDGTDAVMLSAETSIGSYPLQAVQMMADIAAAVDEASASPCVGGRRPRYDLEITESADARESDVEAATADAAVQAASDLRAGAIVVFTLSGATAMKIAKRRPASAIYALTPSPDTYSRLALVWGVAALQTPFGKQTDQILAVGEEQLLKSGKLKKGDTIVIVSGAMPVRGATNFLKIRRIGE